ncbi:hypothetical protein [Pseudomonas plecoglossicida]|uniref:hypothetical protein n=1 Tax=Pseudomonas plecoglossicida TaxID=70775 RepID=UPI002158CBE6|nr:hypothetical protein [Pseudomonas plecoglossicida]
MEWRDGGIGSRSTLGQVGNNGGNQLIGSGLCLRFGSDYLRPIDDTGSGGNTATHIATMQSERHDPQYEWQMLAQMACTGRSWADFVSYDDRLPEQLQYVCHRFERDFKRIREMEAEIKAFLEELGDLEKEMRERMKEAA